MANVGPTFNLGSGYSTPAIGTMSKEYRRRRKVGKNATVTVHPAYRIGDISPRLFGAFLEPIGSMVNGSM
jgi:hypothetical protein